jgi:fucose 4-O-acetylase-like acetyltransferase
VGNSLSGNVLTYSIGILFVLKLIYDAGATISDLLPWKKALVLLGQYSLISYVTQIVFLFALRKLIPTYELPSATLVAIVVVTCLSLFVMCTLLGRFRQNSLVIDRTYRLLFA